MNPLQDTNAASKYENKFEGHASYLNPQWNDGMMSGSEEDRAISEGLSHNLQYLVTTELNSYIQNHVQFYREALVESGHNESDGGVLLELDATQESIIQKHAETNFSYCKKLLHYLIKAHVDDDQSLHLSKLHAVLEEYFEYAPGPWREVALVEVLTTSILPRALQNLRNIEKKQAESSSFLSMSQQHGAGGDSDHRHAGTTTSSVDAPAVDDDTSESITSSSFDEGTDDFSETGSVLSLPNLSRSDQNKIGIKLKKTMIAVNRSKAEIAMLRESLSNARSHDVTLLQDKLRGAQSDLIAVRRRNTELKDRVQTLEATVFQALSAGNDADVGNGEDSGSVRRNNYNYNTSNGRDVGIDDDEDDFRDTFRNKTERRDQPLKHTNANPSSAKSNSTVNGKGVVSIARGIAAQAQAQAQARYRSNGNGGSSNVTDPPRLTDERVGTNAWLQARQAQSAQTQVNELQKQIEGYKEQIIHMQSNIDNMTEAAAVAAADNEKNFPANPVEAQPNGSKIITDTKALEKAPLSKLLSALPAVVSKSHRRLIDNAAQEILQASKDVDRRTIEAMIKENDRLVELLETSLRKNEGPSKADLSERKGDTATGDSANIEVDAESSAMRTELDSPVGETLKLDVKGLRSRGQEKKTKSQHAASLHPEKRGSQRGSHRGSQSHSHTLAVYGPGSIVLAILVGFILSLVVPLLRSLRGQHPY